LLSGVKNEPVTYVSESNRVVLEFQSDLTINDNGFFIVYSGKIGNYIHHVDLYSIHTYKAADCKALRYVFSEPVP